MICVIEIPAQGLVFFVRKFHRILLHSNWKTVIMKRKE